jgi:hypothetical protein
VGFFFFFFFWAEFWIASLSSKPFWPFCTIGKSSMSKGVWSWFHNVLT